MSGREGKRILIVGCGKMGEAILAGWLQAGAVAAADVVVVQPTEERRAYVHDRYRVACVSALDWLVGSFDMVLLGVKPQVMPSVLAELRDMPLFAEVQEKPVFVSIAAGLSTKRLEEMLGFEAPVVRVMPNVALQVGCGASAVCAGTYACDAQLQQVRDLFALLGDAVVLGENLMDASCALNGSGPAYVARMIECLRDAAVEEGLDAALAERLALQTVYGTAALMKERAQSARETKLSVCSPGGTTLAALDAMEKAGFEASLHAGVAAAVARSKELAQC